MAELITVFKCQQVMLGESNYEIFLELFIVQ